MPWPSHIQHGSVRMRMRLQRFRDLALHLHREVARRRKLRAGLMLILELSGIESLYLAELV